MLSIEYTKRKNFIRLSNVVKLVKQDLLILVDLHKTARDRNFRVCVLVKRQSHSETEERVPAESGLETPVPPNQAIDHTPTHNRPTKVKALEIRSGSRRLLS